MSGQDTPELRVVFLGAGAFACPALQRMAVRKDITLSAVVTQPDRPSGRRQRLAACPAMASARELGVNVLTPERIGAPETLDQLRALAPDLFVVVDYGKFLPGPVLDIPRFGSINIHPSLLPRYRGAAPIQWAMARGDRETGVTILFVTPGMDAGDIVLQAPALIGAEDTALTLAPRLAEQGAELLDRALDLFRAGPVSGRPQDESGATFAPKLTKNDGRVDWTWPAEKIHNRVRAFQPWPGCFTEAPTGSGRTLRLIEVRSEPGQGEPGALLSPGDDGHPRVGTGNGVLRLVTVQPEGRTPMSGRAWACGYARDNHVQMGESAEAYRKERTDGL